MEKIIIDMEHESYVIHLNEDDQWKRGDVYPIGRFIGEPHEKYFYNSLEDNGPLDTEEGARCLFEFAFCWRGVWEGRIYFKDDEYWSEELEEINLLWNEIEKIFKERIKKEDPTNTYDD